MLKAEGKINDTVIENMLSWRHSGFNVYCGSTIWPNNDNGLEDLARYIIRDCFSAERMTYLPEKNSLDGGDLIFDSQDNLIGNTNGCNITGFLSTYLLDDVLPNWVR